MSSVKPILLFDGVCNLCNLSVRFIIKRTPENKFLFASQQSAGGKSILENFHLPSDSVNFFVLIDGNKAYMKSTATFEVLKRLNGILSLLYIFIFIPPSIRDFMYNIIAKNRYKWFGKQDHCPLPTPDMKDRFLDE
jgi:predicted DCC family thiol-disulfide oxidoreductase YuxK